MKPINPKTHNVVQAFSFLRYCAGIFTMLKDTSDQCSQRRLKRLSQVIISFKEDLQLIMQVLLQ